MVVGVVLVEVVVQAEGGAQAAPAVAEQHGTSPGKNVRVWVPYAVTIYTDHGGEGSPRGPGDSNSRCRPRWQKYYVRNDGRSHPAQRVGWQRTITKRPKASPDRSTVVQ